MTFTRTIFFIISLILMTPSPCLAQPKRHLLLAAENSWPPYSDINGNGISKDIVRQALSNAGYTVEFIAVPYARALLMTENGQVDGSFNVTKQTDTKRRFDFGKQKLLSATASYFYPKNSALAINSPSDIPKRSTIALIIGYEYGEEYERIRQNLLEVRVSSQKQIIGLLKRNLVDMAIMFDEVATYNLAQMGMLPSELKKGHINHISNIYVAFSKKRGDLSQVISDFDQQLRLLYR
ncbi:MAG: polar amino acid transport system substrate-binding protein [Paraglaciecola sp.]|jgi:polar amino acid transport system substrate-binding protein